MREVVLDTETTGLEPAQGHRVIEIGCLELKNRRQTGRRYHAFVNPERDVPEDARRVSNLSAEFLRDKPLFGDIAEAFLEFVADSQLVIHNAEFDLKFLNAELERVGRPLLEARRAVDTMLMARQRFPGAPASLDALCRRFNIALDQRQAQGHSALLDAELLAEVYLELSGGRQPGLELSMAVAGTLGLAPGERAALPARPRPLLPRLTGEEVTRHEAAVAALGANAIWNLGAVPADQA